MQRARDGAGELLGQHAVYNVGVASSVAPLFALWPAPQTEVLTSGGLPTGIAKSFSNPLQRIREDFGTARIDQVFSNNDTLSGVYTIDDSFANTPTADPLSLDVVSLREQVASLSETHIFSPTLVNKATVGFSRGGFYFNGYLPTFAERAAGFCSRQACRRSGCGRRNNAQRREPDHDGRHERGQ